MRIVLTILASAALLVSLLSVARTALATDGNNGTVKIHEGATETEPVIDNEPHVCTFHLHFFFADDPQAGDWWIQTWEPTGDGTTILTGTYDALDGEDIQPATGVYTLAAGHYKLFWMGDEEKTDKQKVFWVDCGTSSSSSSSSASSSASSSGGHPDTEISKTASVTEIPAGGSYFYTLTVVNVGTAEAVNVIAWDDLDVDLTIDSIVPSQGTCDPPGASNEILCHLGNLAPQASATITINVTASETDCSPVKNRGHVDADNEAEVSHSNQVIVDVVCEGESSSTSTSASSSASSSSSASGEGSEQGNNGSPSGSASGEGGVKGGTGTPGASLPNGSTDGSNGGGMPAIAFAFLLVASLGGLAVLNVATVRRRR